MNPLPNTTAVFFPPRIVKMNLEAGDSHDVMNDVRDRYLDEGVVCLDENGVRQAMAIINYAALFPEVCDPDYKPLPPGKDRVFQLPITPLPETAADMVNHPPHYTFGKYEVIDVIEDWKLDLHRGSAVQYIARSAHKGSEVQDLEKAVWYLQRKIAQLKTPPATP